MVPTVSKSQEKSVNFKESGTVRETDRAREKSGKIWKYQSAKMKGRWKYQKSVQSNEEEDIQFYSELIIPGSRCKSKTSLKNQDRSRLSTNHRRRWRDRSRPVLHCNAPQVFCACNPYGPDLFGTILHGAVFGNYTDRKCLVYCLQVANVTKTWLKLLKSFTVYSIVCVAVFWWQSKCTLTRHG